MRHGLYVLRWVRRMFSLLSFHHLSHFFSFIVLLLLRITTYLIDSATQSNKSNRRNQTKKKDFRTKIRWIEGKIIRQKSFLSLYTLYDLPHLPITTAFKRRRLFAFVQLEKSSVHQFRTSNDDSLPHPPSKPRPMYKWSPNAQHQMQVLFYVYA